MARHFNISILSFCMGMSFLSVLVFSEPLQAGICDSWSCTEYGNGDINGDTVLNVLDVVGVVPIILAGDGNTCVDVADANCDGDVNVADLVALVQSSLGNPNEQIPEDKCIHYCPCYEEACLEPCTLCAPVGHPDYDPGCMETMEAKVCDLEGKCARPPEGLEGECSTFCEAPIDCFDVPALLRCVGHWECGEGFCEQKCEGTTCGDGVCDLLGGESPSVCPLDCPTEGECAPQMAWRVGDCEPINGWRWNGSDCEVIGGCECGGPDCDILYGSSEDCNNANAQCDCSDDAQAECTDQGGVFNDLGCSCCNPGVHDVQECTEGQGGIFDYDICQCVTDGECEEPIDCIDQEWSIRCYGHFECIDGECSKMCEPIDDGEGCGDQVCSPEAGENAENCPDCVSCEGDPPDDPCLECWCADERWECVQVQCPELEYCADKVCGEQCFPESNLDVLFFCQPDGMCEPGQPGAGGNPGCACGGVEDCVLTNIATHPLGEPECGAFENLANGTCWESSIGEGHFGCEESCVAITDSDTTEERCGDDHCNLEAGETPQSCPSDCKQTNGEELDSCRAQLAMMSGNCAMLSSMWRWDGESCMPLGGGCGCQGPDCDSLYPSDRTREGHPDLSKSTACILAHESSSIGECCSANADDVYACEANHGTFDWEDSCSCQYGLDCDGQYVPDIHHFFGDGICDDGNQSIENRDFNLFCWRHEFDCKELNGEWTCDCE